MTPSRIPPHSEECERGILGSILLDATRVMDLCDEKNLVPEAFYIPAHAIIYECISAMHTASTVIDGVSVSDYLRTKEQLDRIGGSLYLDQLIDSTPTSAHASFYLTTVLTKYKLREIITVSRNTEAKCYESEDSPDTIIDDFESTIISLAINSTKEKTTWSESVRDSMTGIEHILSTNRGLAGLSTGFLDLDRSTLGFKPAEVIVLAARPSQGKSSLMLNIAENIVTGKGDPDGECHPVAIFSAEMSQEQLTTRMLCGISGISYFKLIRGGVTPEAHQRLKEAAATIAPFPIYCDDSSGLDIKQLRLKAKRLQNKHGIKCVMIDYLQLLNSEAKAKHGRQIETADISGQIKAMAKDLKIPVLALSQLSRIPGQGKDAGLEIPRLANLRDSGAIEQDADMVLFLRRPSRYENDPNYNDKTRADITIPKNRNGPTGKEVLNFNDEITRFTDRARESDYLDDLPPRPQAELF